MTAGRNDVRWKRYKGDVEDTIIVQIGGVTNLDLVTAVIGQVYPEDRSAAHVVLTAAVTDSPNRLVTIQLGTWLQTTATPGDYELKVRLSFGTKQWTWPEEGHAVITVMADQP
jgi:hypothetical protein